jgi:hypothetical protein
MAFVNDFLKSLAMPIGDLAKWLEEEHQVSVSDTIEKWNELTGMQVVVSDNSTTCEEVEEQTVNINKKNVVKNNALISTCQHVFIAGHRKGQQCTTKPKGGNDRCSAHKIKVSDNESATQVKTLKKRTVKKIKSKEIVKTDSESETPKKSMFDTDSEEETETVVPVTKKPKKKIPISDSESEPEDEKPAPKKNQKKIPPKGTDSEDNE